MLLLVLLLISNGASTLCLESDFLGGVDARRPMTQAGAVEHERNVVMLRLHFYGVRDCSHFKFFLTEII
jgi:hypothetical protein